MFFITLLILTTLAIAGSAAFFSIYGLAQIFTGSFWPVVIMASSLEAGKLISASYVYRYWKKIGFLMKTYLITAIFILMLITSAGIFGFLSSAYQQDVLPLEEMETRITLFEERKLEIADLKQERISQRARLDAQIDAIPGNHSTNRRKMREAQKGERDQIDLDLKQFAIELQTTTSEHHKLKTAVIQQKVHTGPIIFIAEAFGRDIDDATKWMILLIIFAFDPLAVILTIGANIAIIDRSKEKATVTVLNKQTEEPVNEETTNAIRAPLEELLNKQTEEPVNEENTADAIRAALEELQNKEVELTPVEIAQKNMLEEMLRRKEITETVRRGTNSSS
jgi:hypothetical protein